MINDQTGNDSFISVILDTGGSFLVVFVPRHNEFSENLHIIQEQINYTSQNSILCGVFLVIISFPWCSYLNGIQFRR